MKTIEEIKAAIATVDESDATYTDGSTAADIIANGKAPAPKAKTTTQPAVKNDTEEEGFNGWLVSDLTVEEIIKDGIAPGAGSKSSTMPA
jgi:hypothetical protein